MVFAGRSVLQIDPLLAVSMSGSSAGPRRILYGAAPQLYPVQTKATMRCLGFYSRMVTISERFRGPGAGFAG